MLPQGPVDIARLTEPASPDAAPLDLQNHPVLGNLLKWDKRFLDIGYAVHIHNKLFCNLSRSVWIIRFKTLDRPVLSVGYVIESRDVNTRNTGRHLQKLPAAFLLFFRLFVGV